MWSLYNYFTRSIKSNDYIPFDTSTSTSIVPTTPFSSVTPLVITLDLVNPTQSIEIHDTLDIISHYLLQAHVHNIHVYCPNTNLLLPDLLNINLSILIEIQLLLPSTHSSDVMKLIHAYLYTNIFSLLKAYDTHCYVNYFFAFPLCGTDYSSYFERFTMMPNADSIPHFLEWYDSWFLLLSLLFQNLSHYLTRTKPICLYDRFTFNSQVCHSCYQLNLLIQILPSHLTKPIIVLFIAYNASTPTVPLIKTGKLMTFSTRSFLWW